MIKSLFVITLLCFFCSINACSRDASSKNKTNNTITAELKPIQTRYYYTGMIQPLKTVVVTSPAEGVIEDMAFHYGDQVNAKQPLFTIYSDKFQTDYKNALMQYIKAKTEFNNSRSQLTEAEFLHKNELISDDDFKSKQTTFYTSQLTMVQSQDALSEMLKQLNIKGFNLYALTIQDIDKITRALHTQDGSQKLQVSSPTKGVALLPMKSDSTDTKKFSKGEMVKQGDLLALIGDISGLTIHINVNEFNVNQLVVGQKVIVTGTAFPQYNLEGHIASVDRQGQASQGGLPVFPVEVIVPTLTSEQQAVIHMGMSAKVEITIESEPVISVPLAAVFEKKGMPYVQVKKNNKIQDVLVKTGQTTENAVVIEANIKAGDNIVIAS
jgi:HlyD family secretion protein